MDFLSHHSRVFLDFDADETAENTSKPKYDDLSAESMLDSLHLWRLEVILTDAPDQRHGLNKIRMVQTQNPKWYRDFCELYPSARGMKGNKFDTRIKRNHTIKALEEILDGKTSGSVYILYRQNPRFYREKHGGRYALLIIYGY